ncbi:hypothetical protein CTB96_16150 [Cryobacterium arcticum]|uniref:Uncharacterized protein n=1 Tax=Cryobacterium arcticum TaxID=670052 RepID=A0A317ZNW0_9MICO|nr:hypothetical protein CTB96_16150 [Cryobacterium arcticum]
MLFTRCRAHGGLEAQNNLGHLPARVGIGVVLREYPGRRLHQGVVQNGENGPRGTAGSHDTVFARRFARGEQSREQGFEVAHQGEADGPIGRIRRAEQQLTLVGDGIGRVEPADDEHGLDRREHGRRGVDGSRGELPAGVDRPAELLVVDHEQQFALVGRIPEQGAGGHIGAVGDRLGGDIVEAPLGEQAGRRGEDAPALVLHVAQPSGGRFTPPRCISTQCRFTQCRFTQCRFTQCRFTQCRFTKCRFTQCISTHVVAPLSRPQHHQTECAPF